jgi:N-acetylmuramoyl-L-alanine amidase
MSHWLKTGALSDAVAAIGAVCLVVLSAMPGLAQEVPDGAPLDVPQVIDMRILNNAERARLIVDLSATTEFATASLGEPNRIVVDVKATGIVTPVEDTEAGNGLIASYALAVASEGRVRATLTLSAPATVQQAYFVEALENQPARLIVDVIPDTAESFANRVAEDLRAAIARAAEPEGAGPPATPAGPSDADGDAVPAGEETAPILEGPEKARPLIVLDPGHGGIDGGAETPGGTREKAIVLDFAKELQRLLVAQDRFDVAMTRDSDTFLRLEDRVTLARANKADLFISIHADKFEDPTIRGTSIYVRDEAIDELNKVLAANENRTDLVAGFAPPDVDIRVTTILVELMRRETRRQSYLAAGSIIKSLGASTRLRKDPLHRADFFVLQAPEVPSILIELGFLSNETDVANLTTKSWRDKTAEAVAIGIAAYFDGVAQN